MKDRSCAGFSMIELLAVLGLFTACAIATVPNLLAALDQYRASGAARYVAARLQEARMDAVARGADTAIRFTRVDGQFQYTAYRDGNRNGVLTLDIERGIDREIQPPQRLTNRFSGVDFGVVPGLPPIEAADQAPGDDPIRLGSGDSITFTPLGTATPGSLYIVGPHNRQFVVRVLGETGRIRILQFDPRRRLWNAL
jgi:type II secretory pathway pseudopilin PulG